GTSAGEGPRVARPGGERSQQGAATSPPLFLGLVDERLQTAPLRHRETGVVHLEERGHGPPGRAAEERVEQVAERRTARRRRLERGRIDVAGAVVLLLEPSLADEDTEGRPHGGGRGGVGQGGADVGGAGAPEPVDDVHGLALAPAEAGVACPALARPPRRRAALARHGSLILHSLLKTQHHAKKSTSRTAADAALQR